MTLQGRDDMLRDLKCILEGKEAAEGFNRAGEALCFDRTLWEWLEDE